MLSFFSSYTGYFTKEKTVDDGKKSEASHEEKKQEFDLTALSGYITAKQSYTTAFELGKLHLALLLEKNIRLITNTNNLTEYKQLLRELYVVYRINEFLEHPTTVKLSGEEVTSVMIDKTGMSALLKQSEGMEGLRTAAEFEITRLYKLFNVKLIEEDLPETLPLHMLTSSGYWSSTLHKIIAALYVQCQKQVAIPLPKNEK